MLDAGRLHRMTDSADWLMVGKVVGAQGLQGELRINPASDFPERFTVPGSRWLRGRKDGEPTEIQLKKGRQLPGRSLFIVRLEGVNSRDAVALGSELLVPASDRPELDEVFICWIWWDWRPVYTQTSPPSGR